ncbi:putative phage replisome organizer [Jeotgalibacillus terrae]|nr:putative phage replisome organizer [Jeotgalibacillus terrae]
MSEVKWIKLSTQMFEDEKIRLIESMPEADTILIIWVKLLAQAGKTNASGYIYLNENIPYTEEMLATIFNRPLNTVRLALQTFRDFGMIELEQDNFVRIANWGKHQSESALEKIRKDTRERVAKHRENKRIEQENSNVTGNGHRTRRRIRRRERKRIYPFL